MNKKALSPELLTRAGNLSLDKARKLLDAGDIIGAIRKSTQGGNLITEGLDRGSQSSKAIFDYMRTVKKASIKDLFNDMYKSSAHTEKTWEKSEARKQMLKATLDKTLSTLFEKNPEVDAISKVRRADETKSLSKIGFKKHGH